MTSGELWDTLSLCNRVTMQFTILSYPNAVYSVVECVNVTPCKILHKFVFTVSHRRASPVAPGLHSRIVVSVRLAHSVMTVLYTMGLRSPLTVIATHAGPWRKISKRGYKCD